VNVGNKFAQPVTLRQSICGKHRRLFASKQQLPLDFQHKYCYFALNRSVNGSASNIVYPMNIA
jgi:hypothetical protein